MRYFRQLPPFGGAMWILGLLLCLVSLMMFVALLNNWFSLGQAPLENQMRIGLIALNLTLLSSVCTSAASYYSYAHRLRRLQRPGRDSLPIAGWRGKVAAHLLFATVPLCAITLAALNPTTSPAFQLVFPVTILAALVGPGANIWTALLMKSPLA